MPVVRITGLLVTAAVTATAAGQGQMLGSVSPDRAITEEPVPGPGGEVPLLRPNHPPISEIPHMPMPEPTDHPVPLEQTQPVIHDAELGETWELPMPAGVGDGSGVGGEGFIGADGLVDPTDESMLGFGTMFTVGPATTFPRRGNAKLVMRFTDQDNITRWFVCSGAMLDAGVVATAGHCVYARDPSGIDIFDWAEEIWVYPGWDGENNGSIFDPPDADEIIQHWGFARGTFYGAWTGWINDGDFNWDWGMIRLNRNTTRSVGMLTGWFAWAYGGSCSFSQDTTYSNYSYPSENCGKDGLHTGRDLYFWDGTFDDCVDSNRLEIDTGGNCLDSVWGGMSGSAAYYFDDDIRRVHAVCSYRQSGPNPSYGGYVRMWEGWHNFLVDFRDDTRGTTFDLEALQYRIDGDLEVEAGESFDDSSVVIANATNADPAPDDYILRVYLSTNNTITDNDTLLATWEYSDVNFGAMSTINFNVPGPNIPSDTPPGDYWIGVILDPNTDSNPSNNATHLWDAQPVTILAPPECGSPASGNCCEANDTPYCDNEDCCEAVCADDPFCCNNTWDDICADSAVDRCEDCFECGSAEAGDCCVANDTAYCDNEECCDAVCADDPFCCNNTWDNICADGAANVPECGCVDECPEDLNNDGVVDGGDLLILLGDWGECDDPGDCPGDLNDDGVVDGGDLLILLAAWGPCPGESLCEVGFVCDEDDIENCPGFEDTDCYCFNGFDGGFDCAESILCSDAEECPDGNCPDGFVCVVDHCCFGGDPICAPECTEPAGAGGSVDPASMSIDRAPDADSRGMTLIGPAAVPSPDRN